MENKEFEKWWDARRQCVLAGGGQYEIKISFAFAAWQHQAARIAELEAQVQQLQRVPLSEEALYEIESKSTVPSRRPEYKRDAWGDDVTIWHETSTFSFLKFARAIEAAHNIK